MPRTGFEPVCPVRAAGFKPDAFADFATGAGGGRIGVVPGEGPDVNLRPALRPDELRQARAEPSGQAPFRSGQRRQRVGGLIAPGLLATLRARAPALGGG